MNKSILKKKHKIIENEKTQQIIRIKKLSNKQTFSFNVVVLLPNYDLHYHSTNQTLKMYQL